MQDFDAFEPKIWVLLFLQQAGVTHKDETVIGKFKVELRWQLLSGKALEYSINWRGWCR